MTLTERHPSTRILALSVMIGTATAVFLSATVVFFMWQSGATWKAALDTGWRLGVLLVLACPSGIAMGALLKYQLCVMETVLPQNASQDKVIEVDVRDDWNGTALDAAQEICDAAAIIATLKYRDGIEPTREACQQYEISQPVWNSARRVAQEMGLVNGRLWTEESWDNVAARLGRLRVDGNAIWCPRRRGMGILRVSEYNHEKKSYILD